MKIEHVAIYYEDLERAKEFFIKYFNAKPGRKYHNEKTGFSSYFLSFESGSRLEIMTRPEVKKEEKNPTRPGYAHIAFSTGSKDNVDSLTTKLKDASYYVLSGPRVTGDGYYESVILDPEGNQIELTV